MRATLLFAAGLLSAVHLGCADLPPISIDVCGNGVVEPSHGEDCDGKGPSGSTCGAPGTTHACRYLCQAQPDCPTGFGCGLDGLCRASSSTWTGPPAVNPHTPEAPLDIVVADADGDGKGDVFEQSPDAVTVHYDVTSSMETEHAVARDAILPAIGPIVELSGDRLADAVVPADLGFFVSLGTQARVERATAYGAISLPPDVSDVQAFAADVLPEQPGTETLVIAEVALPGMPSTPVVVDVATSGLLAFIGELPDSPGKLAGPPRAGRLNEDPSVVPCDELVFGYQGKSSVDLLVPCKPSKKGTVLLQNAQTTPLALPRGATIAGPITVEDVDGDGHLDLLVPAARGSGFEIDVAYGRGDGTFVRSPGGDPTTSGDGSAGVAVSNVTAAPLAVADLDGDGEPDWVDPTGAYLSRGDNAPVLVASADGSPWTSAVVGRFDGDALPDIAVGSNQESWLAVYLNHGDDTFTPFVVRTPGTVSLLGAGDFDGDRINDVAVVTTAIASNSTTPSDTLSVAFGSPSGAPAEPKDIGEFHGILELATARAVGGPRNVVDGADELGALAEGSDGSLAFAIIFGRSDRDLRAPYDLARASINEGDVTAYAPVRILPADVDGDGVTDLASLGERIDETSEFRIWANPMQGEASIRIGDSTFSDPLMQGFDWHYVLMGAVDLDGMPGDELVVLGPRADGSGYQSAVASASLPMNGAGRTYAVGTPSNVDLAFTRSELPLPDALSHNGRLRIADVDGDGRKDVVALGQDDENGALVVFFNDGHGALGSPTRVAGADKLDVRDFAVSKAPGDEKPELVLLTTTGVYVVNAHGRDLAVGGAPALSMTAGTPTSPSLITAGDVDGDGVPDLVLAGPLGFEVHLGISANPLDAR